MTLQDARTALRLLRSVDSVYHDVSAGDFLPTGKICELADLECVKHTDCDTKYEVCMVSQYLILPRCTFIGVLKGTPGFMACEFEAQNYLFRRPKTIDRDTLEKRMRVPFRFNPLHDVESILWIATWIFYYHIDREGGQPLVDQMEYFHELFPRGLKDRFSTFIVYTDFHVLPTSFHRAAHVIANMCEDLKVAYTASEDDVVPVYTEPLAKLHSDFIN
ncbi:hypothetical protein EDD15DRAFT_874912 [Pisolithus albus]|nr:hypothetical protein EDD15DRAFT_874912 [Pisolithus albus]